MRRLFILIILIAGCVMSCRNFDRDFPDFIRTTGYFPYQFPIRTIILGNYIYDNSNDNAHKFVISAGMGGVYENKEDRIVDFVLDESLCEDAFFPNMDTIRVLPSNYYRLSDPGKIVIPKGKENGGVEIQLTEAFFNDSAAILNTYVLPLRLTGTTGLDSLLQGSPSKPNADRRIVTDWISAPKDFTMFAVKFVNPYHGSYLHYGKSEVKNATGAKMEERTYSEQYVERNEVWDLTTVSRYGVSLRGTFKSSLLTGSFPLRLNFTSDAYLTQGGVDCSVIPAAGSSYTITGTGKYTINTQEYGGKKRDAIYLAYTISNGNYTYTATDTLVFRDKGIVLETYIPVIKH